MFNYTGLIVIVVLAFLLSLAATILAFIFIVPDKKRAKLGGFGKFLHDTVNFKYLIIEKILQALYIFATTLCIVGGFLMLFYVQPGYDYGWYQTSSHWYGGYGILLMLFGPIILRLSYEFMMMAILLVKNVIQINNKLKGESETKKEDLFTAPTFDDATTYATPSESAAATCPVCGVPLEDGPFCPACGAKVK